VQFRQSDYPIDDGTSSIGGRSIVTGRAVVFKAQNGGLLASAMSA
jgi:hypothetical protein